MKKYSVLVAAIALASVVSGSAYAHLPEKCEPGERHHFPDENRSGDHKKRGHKYRNNPAFEAGLDLTDDQKKTLAAARAEQGAATRDLHEKVRAAREALHTAGENNMDDAMLNQLSANLASLIAQQEVARVKMHRQLLAVLTAEQKQKLETYRAERKNAPRWKESPSSVKPETK